MIYVYVEKTNPQIDLTETKSRNNRLHRQTQFVLITLFHGSCFYSRFVFCTVSLSITYDGSLWVGRFFVFTLSLWYERNLDLKNSSPASIYNYIGASYKESWIKGLLNNKSSIQNSAIPIREYCPLVYNDVSSISRHVIYVIWQTTLIELIPRKITAWPTFTYVIVDEIFGEVAL